MDWNIHKKNGKENFYENGAGKEIFAPSKLKSWTFFWGQGECE